MLEICPSIAAGRPTCEIHPLAIGGRDDPVRLVFTAAPGPAVVVALVDLGDRFRLVLNEIEVVPPPEPLPEAPGCTRRLEAEARSSATAAEAWLEAGGSHHTRLQRRARRSSSSRISPRSPGVELLVIDEKTRDSRFSERAALEPRLLPACPGALASR